MKRISVIFSLVFMAIGLSAQDDYKLHGPYEVIARDGQYAYSKNGSEQDMKMAWQLALDGRHAESAAIINAYADNLRRLEGHDAPLCLIQCYWLCRAIILEKKQRKPTWESMVRSAMIPAMEKFERDSPYANGNWGAIVNRCRMAAAICMDDTLLYCKAIEYYLHGYDNGSLPYYISETGQCQETGRDQAHTQLGLEALCETCDMAWTYGKNMWKGDDETGVDLWSAYDNRLMKGLEYTARYNLGYDVPFEKWKDLTGLYCEWTEPGQMGRGSIRTIWKTAFNHYVGEKHLNMPYTKRIIDLQEKAEKRGEIRNAIEANTFQVTGVIQTERMHQVFTYHAPDGAPLKHDYDVYIKPRGKKEWTSVDTYMAKVNACAQQTSTDKNIVARHRVSEISYAMFDFTGDVFVRVVSKNKKFKSARIRPDYRGVIANVQNDSTLQFLLFQQENLSVEFDGDITNNLLIFTSKPPVTMEDAKKNAKKQGRGFIYIPPGYYDDLSMCSPLLTNNKGKEVVVPSNTTLYLAGGCYVKGTFAIEDAENVSILGRGIARPDNGYEGCHVYRSKNVVLDGMVVNTCPIGNSDNVTLHDVRSISFPGWGDGLNVFASENILYDRVFCRNSDDCATAYATRKGFNGNTRNIHMRNSVLWADVAHPIFIGIHGNPEVGDTIEHLTYENIDILGQAEPQVDYQGCLAINSGDGNVVRDVLFDNIRIEKITDGCITQVKVGYNQKYCSAPGRGVEDITFRNVRYNSSKAGDDSERSRNLSIICGYDSLRLVKNITFEGLKIDGHTIYDKMPGKPGWYTAADCMPVYVGNHVSDVRFKKEIKHSTKSVDDEKSHNR